MNRSRVKAIGAMDQNRAALRDWALTCGPEVVDTLRRHLDCPHAVEHLRRDMSDNALRLVAALASQMLDEIVLRLTRGE